MAPGLLIAPCGLFADSWDLQDRLGDSGGLILMSEETAKARGIKPLARLLSNADAAHAPEDFTTAPSKALPIALDRAGLSMEDMELVELNEAFAVVGLANSKLMGLVILLRFE